MVIFRYSNASAYFNLWAYTKIDSLVGIIPRVCCPLHKQSCVCIKPFVRELGTYRYADEMPQSFPMVSWMEPTTCILVKAPTVIILNACQQRPMLVEADFGIHARIRVINLIQ